MSSGVDSTLVRKGIPGRPLIGRLAVAATLLVAGGALVTVALQDPAQGNLFPPCPFRWATGLECAGCGTLRCIHQLLRGHPVAAFHHNPMTILVLAGLALGGILRLIRRSPWREGCLEDHAGYGSWTGAACVTRAIRGPIARLHGRRGWFLLALILLWWLGRNIY